MHIVRTKSGRLGVWSWTTGFVPSPLPESNYEAIARKSPRDACAIAERLWNQGREEEALEILDLYGD